METPKLVVNSPAQVLAASTAPGSPRGAASPPAAGALASLLRLHPGNAGQGWLISSGAGDVDHFTLAAAASPEN